MDWLIIKLKSMSKIIFALLCGLIGSSLFWGTFLLSSQMELEFIKTEYLVLAVATMFFITISYFFEQKKEEIK